ncbi:hypothetical protein DV738_g2128, partial [Chaetothyriales sp. CBS 135597]
MAPATLPDSDWAQRRHPISFAHLLSLKQIGPDVFESTSSAYPPMTPPRSYGGHVFAQSAWAAAKTVPKGLVVHNCTGHYILVGNSKFPFRYHVQRVRDGGVYSLRKVEVFQDTDGSNTSNTWGPPVFIATVSFKRDESHKHSQSLKPSERRRDFAHQEESPDYIDRTYASVLQGKRFEDHPEPLGADGIWLPSVPLEMMRLRTHTFPGLDMRKVDMRKYLDLVGFPRRAGPGDQERLKAAAKWKLLLFYRLLREQDVHPDARDNNLQEVVPPEDEDDLNLHACAHLYACDRNSLFLVQRALGYSSLMIQLSSIAQTVVFHAPLEQLKMVDQQGRRKLFVQESWSNNSGCDRVTHNSRLWNYETGTIIATTLQDGMFRVPVQTQPMLDLEADEPGHKQSKI